MTIMQTRKNYIVRGKHMNEVDFRIVARMCVITGKGLIIIVHKAPNYVLSAEDCLAELQDWLYGKEMKCFWRTKLRGRIL